MVAILRKHGTDRVRTTPAVGWGRSDPLPARGAGQALPAAGFTESEVETVLRDTPVVCRGQSGRLDLAEPEPAECYAGNTITRGG